ncbi:MAG: hypothetical protein AAFQ16_11255 [Pseudomonadota bacterium]
MKSDQRGRTSVGILGVVFGGAATILTGVDWNPTDGQQRGLDGAVTVLGVATAVASAIYLATESPTSASVAATRLQRISDAAGSQAADVEARLRSACGVSSEDVRDYSEAATRAAQNIKVAVDNATTANQEIEAKSVQAAMEALAELEKAIADPALNDTDRFDVAVRAYSTVLKQTPTDRVVSTVRRLTENAGLGLRLEFVDALKKQIEGSSK